jgi:uncharacterized membrane protein YccC
VVGPVLGGSAAPNPPRLPAQLWNRLRPAGPTGYPLRRALRAAVVVPVNFAIGSQLIGNPQVATFAAFGSFALLIFANFAGSRRSNLGSYLLLAGAGAVLISLGTLIDSPPWLAVSGMAVTAFVLLFAGVISSVINAGTQAALLAFILAVMVPAPRSVLPDRLLGWSIAVAVCVPVAVLLWPPDDQNVLRARTSELCRALSVMLQLEAADPADGDRLVAMRRAAGALRAAFRTSASRTSAVSTGARTLIRLVDELEWLTTTVTNACADAPERWPEQGQRLRAAAARALATCADLLAASDSARVRESLAELTGRIGELDRARRAVAEETLAGLRASTGAGPETVAAGEFERPLYAAHELGYTVALAARTVAAIAAADTRSWWARLGGRRLQVDELGVQLPGTVTAAQRVASGHLDRHSVWFQNSIRGAAGLGLAVLLARIFDAQNAFWIGLGALSVLRSNALSTGATVLRALVGTVAGFAIGAGIVGILGTGRPLLWTLLPLVILAAAVGPAVLPFIAGQAAFTVFTIVLFNIIAPAGWRVGVLRVEDVALGCLASLFAGVLFWPRGAGAALGTALAEAYDSAATFLHEAVGELLGHPGEGKAAPAASAAGTRLDDALRQYLAERGAKQVSLEAVAALANGASRLRLAGAAIGQLQHDAPRGTAADEGLQAPVAVLDRRAGLIVDWYAALADSFARRQRPLPSDRELATDGSFLDVVLPGVHGCGSPDRATRAEQLLWCGQYLGDVDRLRADLIGPARQVSRVRAASWWQR